MSDPRMIPADEARETLREVKEPTTNLAWSNAWVGDLAHTVVALHEQVERQDARIEQLDTELTAVASHSLAQGRKLRRQEQQLDRVREAAARIDKKFENSVKEWLDGLKSDQYLEAYTDGLDIALAEIEQALGGTDE